MLADTVYSLSLTLPLSFPLAPVRVLRVRLIPRSKNSWLLKTAIESASLSLPPYCFSPLELGDGTEPGCGVSVKWIDLYQRQGIAKKKSMFVVAP